MEDILASIKRIIHDDPAPPRAAAPAPAPAAPAPAQQPLVQPHSFVEPEPSRAAFIPPQPPRAAPVEPPPPLAWPRRSDARTDPTPPDSILELTDRVPETFRNPNPEPQPQAQAQAQVHTPPPLPVQPQQPAPAAEFVPPRAPAAAPAVSPPMQRAVERLRQADIETADPAPRPVPRDLLPRTPAPRATGGDVTLDALVREMLQPMLADWVERNLPDMVERLVQAEIRKMVDKG